MQESAVRYFQRSANRVQVEPGIHGSRTRVDVSERFAYRVLALTVNGQVAAERSAQVVNTQVC